MGLTLRKTVFHMKSPQLGMVDVKLTYNDKQVQASAEYKDDLIFSMVLTSEAIKDYTDWQIVDMGLSNLQEGTKNWRDVTKCRAIISQLSSFRMKSKESVYSLNENGVNFVLNVKADMDAEEYTFEFTNNVNRDVMTFKTHNINEIEIVDNALVYASAINQIALRFKLDQTDLVKNNERESQHKIVVGEIQK